MKKLLGLMLLSLSAVLLVGCAKTTEVVEETPVAPVVEAPVVEAPVVEAPVVEETAPVAAPEAPVAPEAPAAPAVQ